jgi:hypothetical protein
MPNSGHVTALRARRTSYRGVVMRSRLEARFAQVLDSAGLAWSYEPMCFANEHGQYLPDFLTEADDERIYWEVKPPSRDDTVWGWCPGEVGDRMAIVWDSDPDARLVLAVPGWPYGEVIRRRAVRGRLTTDVQVWDFGWTA